jgi:DNA-binding CsgD family transcriptional regulator
VELVGRESERRVIDSVLSAARRGRATSLAFRGEPGIGKSALLDYAVSAAPDLLVLRAAGSEVEQDLPFATLERLVRPLLRHIDSLPQRQQDALRGALALGPATPVGDRFAVYAATFSLLTRRAEAGPVLVCVDDLQWTDVPSRECLLFVARRLDADAVAMVFAERCLMPENSVLGRDASTRVLEVGQLTPEDAHALVQPILGPDAAAVLVDRVLATCAGNPLALLEAATRSAAGHDIKLSAIFAPHISHLDDAARQLVLLLAVAGPQDHTAGFLAARNRGLPQGAVDDLIAQGLLVGTPSTAQIRHPLVRSAALALSAAAQVREAHLALAEVLTDPADVDRRTWHLAAAAVGPDEQVAAALERAGEQYRERLAYASCAAAMERAAELSEAPANRARRALEAARATRLSGDLDRTLRVARVALDSAPDPITAAQAQAILGWMLLSRGTLEEAGTSLRRAGELFEAHDPIRAADSFAGAAAAARVRGDLFGAVQLASRALELGGSETHGSAALAFVTLGVAGMTGGDVHQPIQHMYAAIRALTQSRPAPDEVLTAVYVARAAWPFDLAGLRGVVGELVGDLRAKGALGVLPASLYALAYLDLRAGHLRQAHDRSEEAAVLARSTGDYYIERAATGCLALVWAYLGDETASRDHAAAAIALAERHSAAIPPETYDALGLLELQLGNFDQALRHLDLDNRAAPSEALDLSRWSTLDLAEAYFRSGSPLPTKLAEYAESASWANHPGTQSVVLRVRGLFADPGSYRDHFDQALNLHEQAPMPIEQARTHLCYGERLRRAGARRESREQFTNALRIFERAGAQLLAAHARHELAATGVHVPRAVDAVTSLTAQETRVADAVARGLSNREVAAALFLSEKTVEAHLSRAYRKLGVRSRTQLARRLTEAR